MKNSKLFTFMLCIGTIHSGTVKGLMPAVTTDDLSTHTALNPEPLSNDIPLRIAATWWLPDWQNNQPSRHSADEGGNDPDSKCAQYGLIETCSAPKVSDGKTYPVAGLTCYKSCYCPAQYQFTTANCTGNYTVDGGSCEGKFEECNCKPEFKYNSSNCNGEYQPSGDSCGGNYNDCTIRYDCTISAKTCTYGCAATNSCGRCTECNGNPDCSATPVNCTYGCASTNSCGICVSCSGNPDCNVTAKSCTYGCASTNSCGICVSCNSCTPYANESGCTYGTYSCSDGCGGSRTCCSSAPTCTPYDNESGCTYGTYSCSDGCGGTRTCCSAKPEDPCADVTCPTGVTCGSEGCATYSTATTCCSKVCTQCNEPSPSSSPDPCAGVTCPTAKSCSNGCASYSTATTCCTAVCNACNPTTQEPSPESSPSPSPSEPSDPCAGVGISCSTGCAEYSRECSDKCIRCLPTEAECRKLYPDRGCTGECHVCDPRTKEMGGDCAGYYYRDDFCVSW